MSKYKCYAAACQWSYEVILTTVPNESLDLLIKSLCWASRVPDPFIVFTFFFTKRDITISKTSILDKFLLQVKTTIFCVFEFRLIE